MKPPNPKHSTGKPLQPLQGFYCKGVGYTMSDKGNIRLHGKRSGILKVDFISPEDFADMIWNHLSKDSNDENV